MTDILISVLVVFAVFTILRTVVYRVLLAWEIAKAQDVDTD